MEAQRKELSKAVEDLKVEVAQRTHEIRRLTEELGDKSKQTGLELKDVSLRFVFQFEFQLSVINANRYQIQTIHMVEPGKRTT